MPRPRCGRRRWRSRHRLELRGRRPGPAPAVLRWQHMPRAHLGTNKSRRERAHHGGAPGSHLRPGATRGRCDWRWYDSRDGRVESGDRRAATIRDRGRRQASPAAGIRKATRRRKPIPVVPLNGKVPSISVQRIGNRTWVELPRRPQRASALHLMAAVEPPGSRALQGSTAEEGRLRDRAFPTPRAVPEG